MSDQDFLPKPTTVEELIKYYGVIRIHGRLPYQCPRCQIAPLVFQAKSPFPDQGTTIACLCAGAGAYPPEPMKLALDAFPGVEDWESEVEDYLEAQDHLKANQQKQKE